CASVSGATSAGAGSSTAVAVAADSPCAEAAKAAIMPARPKMCRKLIHCSKKAKVGRGGTPDRKARELSQCPPGGSTNRSNAAKSRPDEASTHVRIAIQVRPERPPKTE